MRKRKDYGLKADARGIYHCDFSVAGQRIQRSTYTADSKAAKEWCAEVASRTWREIQLGEKPSLKWEEAAAEWFKAKMQDGKKGLDVERNRALVLAEKLDGRYLHELHTIVDPRGINLNDYLDDLQQERGLSNAGRNRYRSLINRITNRAREEGYNVPELKMRRMEEIRQEPRALTREEAPIFIADLYAHALHIARPAHFSLACGARQANVTGLRWFKARFADGASVPHVSEDLRTMTVPPAFSKNGKTMRLPLNDEAIAVLREARDCKEHGHKTFVFTFHGQPMEQPYNTSYIAAVKRCGLDGFNWHGLRHTWTTWHLEEGTPLEVVMKLGGWSSIHVLLKHYAHLVDKHVAKYAGNLPSMTPAPRPLAVVA